MKIPYCIRAIALLTLLAISPASAESNPFVGIWRPDIEASIERAKAMVDPNREDISKLEKILPQILNAMLLEISDTTFTFQFGSRNEQSADYTIEKWTEGEATILLTPPEHEPIKATLQKGVDETMILLMDGNDDMNFCVWKLTDSTSLEDPDLAAITAAVLGGDSSPKPAESIRSASTDNQIQNNLRIITSAAQQYMLENGVAEAKYTDLEGEYFTKISPVNGEDYTTLVIRSDTESLSVLDQDGKTHTLR